MNEYEMNRYDQNNKRQHLEMERTTIRNFPKLTKTIPLFMAMLVFFVAAVGMAAATPAADPTINDEETLVRMPVTMAGYFEGAIKDGISGRVLAMGEPSSKTTVHLRYYDGAVWSTADSVFTGGQGGYEFTDVKPLLGGQEYYVRYGPNETAANYVYSWYGPTINAFPAGTRAFGGVFDIQDVPLISPISGAAVRIPVTFKWEGRGLPGETYRIAVLDEDERVFWRSIDLGDVSQLELNALAPDMLYFRQYAWYIEVYSGEDNFGESFMLNDIVFLPPAGQQNETAAGERESPFMRGSGRGGR